MNDQMCSIEHSKHGYFKCFSWSAVLAGAFVGVGLSFLLNLFSIAIGLTVFTTTQEGITAFAIGGFIGFAIGIVVSMFVSGFVAGYLAKPYCGMRNLGCLYGFTTWCVGLLLLVLLSAPLAKYMSISSNALTNHSLTVIKVNENVVAATPVAVGQVDPNAVVDVERATNDMGKAALALFSLFLMGAFFSALGGHCAMSCCKKHCQKCGCDNCTCKTNCSTEPPRTV